jgi:hypothetical protein
LKLIKKVSMKKIAISLVFFIYILATSDISAQCNVPSIASNQILCPGGSLTLTAEGGPYTSYAWSSGQSSESITVTSTGTYTVTVTDANGCTGTDSETVSPGAPANTSIGGQTYVCSNAPVTLKASGNFQSYQWSSGQTTYGITVSTPGTYTVTVTNSDGCTGMATQVVNPAPLPSVVFSVVNPAVCAGECLTFNVTFTGTPPFILTYESPVSGEQTQTFITNTGTLQICPPAGTPPGMATLSTLIVSDEYCECD